MKRKILASFLAILLLLACLLSACSKASDKETPKEDPQLTEEKLPEKTEWKILMIGCSFCYYYPDELFGLAKAAGIKMEISNVYYSGCQLASHWAWLEEPNFQFITFDEVGRILTGKAAKGEGVSLKYCLEANDWDIISIQQYWSPNEAQTLTRAQSICDPYAKVLYDYLKENYPNAALYFNQTWAFQVGFDRSGQSVPDVETQTTMYENIRTVSRNICKENGVTLIPSGDAWQIARANPVIGDTLCARLGVGDPPDAGDNYHDGDIGGGQYLNACVWFEVLTGKSCVGNTFRPKDTTGAGTDSLRYELSEEKIAALQEAAHQAVEAARK